MKWILIIGLMSNGGEVFSSLEYDSEVECRAAEIIALDSAVEKDTAIITKCEPL